LFCHGLDEGADAAEDGVDESALILESSYYECVTTATSLDFAAVENSEGKAAIPEWSSI
jgi:hypothetical protein